MRRTGQGRGRGRGQGADGSVGRARPVGPLERIGYVRLGGSARSRVRAGGTASSRVRISRSMPWN